MDEHRSRTRCACIGGRTFPRKKSLTVRGAVSRARNSLPYVRWSRFFLLVSTGPIYAVEVCSLKPEAHPVYAYLFSVSSFSRWFERGPGEVRTEKRERKSGGSRVESRQEGGRRGLECPSEEEQREP